MKQAQELYLLFKKHSLSGAITSVLILSLNVRVGEAITAPACKDAEKLQYYADVDGDGYAKNATIVKLCPSVSSSGYVKKELAKLNAAGKLQIDCNDVPLAIAKVDSLEKIKIDGKLRNTLLKYNVRDINCDAKYVYTSTLAGSTFCGSSDASIRDAALLCGSQAKFQYITPAAERNKLSKETVAANDVKNVASLSTTLITRNGTFGPLRRVNFASDTTWQGTWLFAKTCLHGPNDVCPVTGNWLGASADGVSTSSVSFPTGECRVRKHLLNPEKNICEVPLKGVCSWGQVFQNSQCKDVVSTEDKCYITGTPEVSETTEYPIRLGKIKFQYMCPPGLNQDTTFLLAQMVWAPNLLVAASKHNSGWFFLPPGLSVTEGLHTLSAPIDIPNNVLPLMDGTLTVKIRGVEIKSKDISKIQNAATDSDVELGRSDVAATVALKNLGVWNDYGVYLGGNPNINGGYGAGGDSGGSSSSDSSSSEPGGLGGGACPFDNNNIPDCSSGKCEGVKVQSNPKEVYENEYTYSLVAENWTCRGNVLEQAASSVAGPFDSSLFCRDGIDNDKDGLIDIADSDCSTDPEPEDPCGDLPKFSIGNSPLAQTPQGFATSARNSISRGECQSMLTSLNGKYSSYKQTAISNACDGDRAGWATFNADSWDNIDVDSVCSVLPK